MVQVERRVGRYDLIEVIGRGGAAVVYLAYQRDLRRRVALKELSQHPIAYKAAASASGLVTGARQAKCSHT